MLFDKSLQGPRIAPDRPLRTKEFFKDLVNGNPRFRSSRHRLNAILRIARFCLRGFLLRIFRLSKRRKRGEIKRGKGAWRRKGGGALFRSLAKRRAQDDRRGK